MFCITAYLGALVRFCQKDKTGNKKKIESKIFLCLAVARAHMHIYA